MISSLHITTNYWFHTIHVCSLALDDDKLLKGTQSALRPRWPGH